jgi:hypothetical protein
MVKLNWGGPPMKKFAVLLVAVCMSAGAASAAAPPAKMPMHKPMMHHHMMMHHWAACAEGMVKASCVCKGATAKAMCKAGQWCHSFAGVCTM